MDLWVDTRWEGRHGIGRYAREVCSRLAMPWKELDVTGSPASPLGAIAPVPRGLIYSPGYNAFLRAERQVLTIHDLIHFQTSWPQRAKYRAFYDLVIKPVVKRAGVVITVSETSRRAISEWLRDDSVEIVNAGIGVSPAFHADVIAASAPESYVMYVGNMRPHKNLSVVLDALMHVPGLRLRALLPPREHHEAHNAFRARGIDDRVDLLTDLTDDELAAQYRGAAATVMPSLIEGFGLPALESLAVGTPIIYWVGCAAVAETVGHNGTAVTGAKSTTEWADALNSALVHPRKVSGLDKAYSWDVTADVVNSTLATA
ncbi:MAG TPA: glycosyltransferase family 4 protein [Candidatus Agrococcus pullicola]|uniref:Glycosyltransferase family 4 protein n=1 Tax=Candidatus Agrococcus pullicola TaxID=2838429 RepID=A0A9D1YV43_9MICO|nr:glycosyltransferase family 4 protein [Candidatus Agrococcus pullicola]